MLVHTDLNLTFICIFIYVLSLSLKLAGGSFQDN